MSKGTEKMVKRRKGKSQAVRGLALLGLTLPGGMLLLAAGPANAMQLYDGTVTGANGWQVSLDTTLSYTGMYRVSSPNSAMVSGITNTNGNDGDANFRHGVIANLFEALPVLDIKNGSFGMHFSGEYFINTQYLINNQNNQPADTLNSITSCKTCFSPATSEAEGHNGRMLDAFIYDSWRLGHERELTVKVGKQTLFWGQSLFYGSNGIAGGQAPVDAVSAQNIVNAQSQQIFLPVGQAVITYKPDLTYTIQGYYQFEWEPSSLQGVGSFFSTSDTTGPGADFLYLAPGDALPRIKALTPPSQNGQFGLSLQAQYGNYDVGLFGLRYDAKNPTEYLDVNEGTGGPGYFRLVYPRDIWIFGTSLGTTVGATNIGAELSVHTHAPLASSGQPQVSVDGTPVINNLGNANGDPSYAVGDLMTGLLSFIYGSPSLPFDPGGITVAGEIEYLDVFKVTHNPMTLNLTTFQETPALAPGRSQAAASFDVSVTPTYNEVLPFLQITFPMSLKYNFAGNSEYDATMNHGSGTFTVGVGATYKSVWSATLSFVDPFGNSRIVNDALEPEGYGDLPPDRKYLELNLQRTF